MSLPAADLVITGCAEVVTAEPGCGEGPLGVIRDGAVAVAGERILWVGKARELRRAVAVEGGTRLLEAHGGTVCPGFVDSHTHLLFAGSREGEFAARSRGVSYPEIAAAGGGIQSTVRATREASPAELFRLAWERLASCLCHGSTTVEVKSGYGLSPESELRCLRVIRRLAEAHPVDVVPTFLGAHALPPEFASRRDAYLDCVLQEMLPAVAAEGLAEFCDVFCEDGYFTPAESERILRAAAHRGMKSKIHADEFAPSGGAEVAAAVGAVSADHLLCVTEGGIGALKAAGVVATLLPGTAAFLGLGRYAPARAMLAAGLTVALATDFNPGSCMTESMPLIIHLACTQMKMHPEEALLAATMGGAAALARTATVGSLRPGKQADLLLLDCPNHLHLAYRFGINPVRTVLTRGRVVVEDWHLAVPRPEGA
ncbi:MAG: imidazolonepropionase [candidate division NC10 bacterium]|nr:imidazolonepropionase [candidate division NC10 bacterium]